MALASTIEWDVRTGGSDSNGGGFNVGASGTDYSQQTSPQITYTDLVIGASNTQLTSAGNPFTSAHVGNVINITGGTGFTTGRYYVSSVSGSTATMDRAVGTASSTGGAGKLGGSFATISAAYSASTTGNTIHVQAGTYTLTSVINVNSTTQFTFVGYNTSHYDDGTPPLVTTATNSTNLFAVSENCAFRNFSFSNTATTRAMGIEAVGNTACFISRCTFDGFTYGLNSGALSGSSWFAHLTVIDCEFKNCTTYGAAALTGRFHACYFHSNAVGLYLENMSQRSAEVTRCIIVSSTNQGVLIDQNSTNCIALHENTIANNGSSGVAMSTNSGSTNPLWLSLYSNLFYGNGAYGVDLSTSSAGVKTLMNQNNAYGGNTSGARRSLSAGVNDVSLSAGPFTNSGSGDYSLNSTAGGGAACKAAGWPGSIQGLSTTAGYLDIGAFQGPASSGAANFGFIG